MVADYHSTYHFLTTSHVREVNPFGKLLDEHPKALVVVGASIEAPLTWWAYKKLENHKRWRAAILIGAAAGRSYLAIRNYKLAEKWAR